MTDDTAADDKPFEPSQKKLDDARAKGEIARSADLTTAAGYCGLLIVSLTIGPAALAGLASALAGLVAKAPELAGLVFSGNPAPVMGGLFVSVIVAVAPWLGLPAVLAILSIAAQRGFVAAPSKLAPKLDRISPLSGLRNKFGRQGLFEFIKSTTKLLIYAGILGVFLQGQSDRILGSLQLAPGLILVELGRMLTALMTIVCVVALTMGAVDFIWQRANHLRKNRMTLQEMREEIKQAEGDPMLKQQRRQKGVALAMNRMLADVPTADVVIVNPTHYAVALKWDRGSGAAPVCVAKGVDEVAARIRTLAHEHAVPVHSDPPTARALHASVEVGSQIMRDQYGPVAAAIRFAENIRKRARQP